jgi:hypothetical protein
MASNRQKKKRIQKRKMTTRGKSRKRLIQAKGTTPKFPIHPEKLAKTIDVTTLKLAKQDE